MKLTVLGRFFLLVSFAFAVPALAADKPGLPIGKAIALAEESLASKGQGNVYIESIVLEKSTVISKKRVWVITWSDTIPGSREGSREVGLEIDMQGEVVHLIGGGRGKKLSNSPH